MAPLPGLVKDATPPATDTEVSPIVIPDGTTLLTTKQHNKIVDYLSGDAGPDFIPQNAINSLVSDLAAKEDSLGFTPEDVSNKATDLTTPDNTKYPTTQAVQTGLDLKENSLGFTPENISNKVTSIGTPGNDTNYPTEKAVRTALDGKEDSLGFTAENISNKTTSFQVTPDDIKYPTEKLVKDSLDGKEDSLGFTPEDTTNKNAVNGYAGLDGSSKLVVSQIPTGIPQTNITDLTTDLSNKQPIDSDLTSIAGLTPANDDIIQRKAGAWVNSTPIQFKADLSLVKADVGLGNVDNTSDADKPVSTAQQTALDLKEDDLGFTPENISNKATSIGTPGNDNNYPTEKAVRDALDLKENSLGFTAEDISNKATDLTSPDNDKYPTTLAVQNGLDDISPIGLHDLWIDVRDFVPVDSGALTTRIIGSGVNQKSISYMPFAPSVDTFAVVKFKLPRNYNNGDLTVVVNWTAQAGATDDVEWGLSGVAVSDDEDLTAAATNYGTEVLIVHEMTGIDLSEDTVRSDPITLANTPVDGDTIYLKVRRFGTSIRDDFLGDAQLLGVYLEYTTDAAVSA